MFRKGRQRRLVAAGFLLSGQITSAQQTVAIARSLAVHLRVEGGTPLRLYITHRAWYRRNETIEARFAEPVWAFDRIVIPAGTAVQGQVTRLDPIPGMVRARDCRREFHSSEARRSIVLQPEACGRAEHVARYAKLARQV
jgi:hypothetical protein